MADTSRRKGPCVHFQRGTCRFGDICKYSHDETPLSGSKTKKPCFDFAKGKCRRGAWCPYSHDTATSSQQLSKSGDAGGTKFNGSSAYDQYVDWSFDIKQHYRDIKRAQPLGNKFPTFIQKALTLVESGFETMQEVILSLSSEGGLARLGELFDIDLASLNDDGLHSVFKNSLLPALQIMAHESVLSSSVLEGRHATICNFLYGINGKRSVAVFRAAIRGLTYDEEITADIEPCLIALSAVIEINGSAHINEDLRNTAETMIALASSRPFIGIALKYHKKMCLNLGLGDQVKEMERARKGVTLPKATFEVPIDQPGDLSTRGPRHDNDFDNIEDIQILPTMDEIRSDRAEYLPRNDPLTWHLPGAAGLIDRQFRLVREDTVGQLRDAAKFELDRLQGSKNERGNTKQPGTRTYSYQNVRLVNVELDDRLGLLCVLGFDQPRELSGKTAKQREDWWTDSKRLCDDALITLLAADGTAIFMTVAARTSEMPSSKKTTTPIEMRYPRSGNDLTAQVVLQPVNNTESDIETLLFHFGLGNITSNRNLSFSLLEFPGVLLSVFQHTLTALQRMSQTKDLPFAEVLAPTDSTPNDTQVELPAYARTPGFRFDLSILSNIGEAIELDPRSPPSAISLSEQTTLDLAQADALIATLSRELALIQGPPGTGKSYTGVAITKSLLNNKKVGRLGPLLVVTYTNHALDQILESLDAAGVEQIIRIGSRSKSERLSALNLRVVSRSFDHTKVEKRQFWDYKTAAEKHGNLANTSLEQLHRAFTDEGVLSFLQETYPDFAAQLCQPEVNDEGFQEVSYSRKPRDGLRGWLFGERAQDAETQLGSTTNLFSLKATERQALYLEWKQEIAAAIQRPLLSQLKAYEEAKAGRACTRAELEVRVLLSANVVGVTTSGLARNLNLLRRLNSKVILVEEAGEVLEAHLLTAMLPSIEHAILIGDHQQLRPKAQNYDLSCENPRSQIKLDVSLFERLVKPQDSENQAIPFVTLETQRRMHPSISRLIRETLYPHLQDAPVVANYPPVVGMSRRLFWMDHDRPEDREADKSGSTSHTNMYEVDMVFALVRHLVRQGVYTASDIAVLTPYLGQLKKLRRALSSFAEIIVNDRDIDDLAREGDDSEDEISNGAKEANVKGLFPPALRVAKSTLLKALRLATVDNFQGEEAKVVIISLVRCNAQRRCGFLRTSNRINVLLSRAQHGMYIIGNTDTSAHVPMWGQVLEILRSDGNVGDHLELCCPRHPDTPLQATSPDDFARISPEGGCDLLCGQRLPCGHSCTKKCHSEGLHRAVYCTKPCNRVKEGCNHNCKYECGRKCDELCGIIVDDIDLALPCGHRVTSLQCYQYQDPSKAMCMVDIERVVPGCEHKVILPCHVDVSDESYICTVRCGATLACGHTCNYKCCNCRQLKLIGADHGICQQPCGRKYTNCKHSCTAKCHVSDGEGDCPLCEQVCDVQCSHTRCNKKCSEPCTPCAEDRCASHCPHAACSMPCAAPCDWVPCSKRCTKRLSCGHQCPSICGADCPSKKYCQICAPDEIKELRADILMFGTYGEVDLAESPCLFLPCDHVFTVESLDGIMSMGEHYDLDAAGLPVAIKGNSEPFSYKEIKVCPDCRGSLRMVPRYGRIVRRALLDESTKKFIAWSNREYVAFATKMEKFQQNLIESQSEMKLSRGDVALNKISHVGRLSKLHGLVGRYRNLADLRARLDVFVERTAVDAQPFKRVRDSVESVRRRRLNEANQTIDSFQFDETILQTRGSLLAGALAIRCELVALTDFISVFDSQSDNHDRSLTVNFSQDRLCCEFLLKAAERGKAILQQSEALIFWAHFAGLECSVMEAQEGSTTGDLVAMKKDAHLYLDRAKDLCTRFPNQTKSVAHEVNDVQKLLQQADYRSEMKMVVAVMAKEFSGTGHWYRCENGHPFTIGECGMPMELAGCPECNAPIGGRDHATVAGVAHAQDIEREFGRLQIEDDE